MAHDRTKVSRQHVQTKSIVRIALTRAPYHFRLRTLATVAHPVKRCLSISGRSEQSFIERSVGYIGRDLRGTGQLGPVSRSLDSLPTRLSHFDRGTGKDGNFIAAGWLHHSRRCLSRRPLPHSGNVQLPCSGPADHIAVWSVMDFQLPCVAAEFHDCHGCAIHRSDGGVRSPDSPRSACRRPAALPAHPDGSGCRHCLFDSICRFVFDSLALSLFRVALGPNWRLWPWVAGGLSAAAAVIAPIMIRNAQTIGSWRGGHTDGGGLPPFVVLFNFFKAAFEIVLGSNAKWRLDVWAATFLFAAAYLVVRQYRAMRRGQEPSGQPAFAPQALTWIAIISGIYALGIILTELTAFAWDTRYYFPLYPLALVCLGVFLTPASNARSRIACAACAISLLVYNARSIAGPGFASEAIRVNPWLQQEVEPGVSMKMWLKGHATGGEAVVATDGQAVQYLTGLPVVAVIPAHISTRKWDEASLRDLMRRFRASYVLVFPGAGPNDVIEQRIPLFKGLTKGSAPSWLAVAARSRDGLLYSCADCMTGSANPATGQQPPFGSRSSSSSSERAH